MGSNIAYWLSRGDYHIRAVFSKVENDAVNVANKIPTGVAPNLESTLKKCDIVFITIPESEMTSVLEQISAFSRTKTELLIHMSGVLPSSIIGLAGMEYKKLSMHPMAGIPPLDVDNNPFTGVCFGVEGDDEAIPIAHKIIKTLGGYSCEIDVEHKGIYHTSAGFAANAVYALIFASREMLTKAGFPEDDIPKVVANLMTRAIRNYTELGLTEGMTGPITRDDFETLATHLQSIENNELQQLYIDSIGICADILGKRNRFDKLVESFVNKK